MNCWPWASDQHDISQIGDEIRLGGWYMHRQQFPSSLHTTPNYAYTGVIDDFLGDLARAVGKVHGPGWHKFRDVVVLRAALG